jgi:hypothetical protein
MEIIKCECVQWMFCGEGEKENKFKKNGKDHMCVEWFKQLKNKIKLMYK